MLTSECELEKVVPSPHWDLMVTVMICLMCGFDISIIHMCKTHHMCPKDISCVLRVCQTYPKGLNAPKGGQHSRMPYPDEYKPAKRMH